jgi:hypothetical protein
MADLMTAKSLRMLPFVYGGFASNELLQAWNSDEAGKASKRGVPFLVQFARRIVVSWSKAHRILHNTNNRMSDLGTFVAASLRDKTVQELLEENKRLKQQNATLQRPPQLLLVHSGTVYKRGGLLGALFEGLNHAQFLLEPTTENKLTLSQLLSSQIFMAGRDEPLCTLESVTSLSHEPIDIVELIHIYLRDDIQFESTIGPLATPQLRQQLLAFFQDGEISQENVSDFLAVFGDCTIRSNLLVRVPLPYLIFNGPSEYYVENVSVGGSD